MTTDTPEQQFIAYTYQRVTGANGEDLTFTGNTVEALEFLKKYEDLELDITYHSTHVAVEDSEGNYWGTGSTLDEALRYLLAAVFTPSED